MSCETHDNQVGIGLDLAEHLINQGYRLALVGRRAQLGQDVASRLDPTGDTVIFVQCDVSSYDDQSIMFKAVWEKWKRIEYVSLSSSDTTGTIVSGTQLTDV